MRKVTVYSTVGNTMQEVFCESALWGELQQELAHKGIATSGMKAIHGETQLTFESNQAVLPEGEFILFLMPGKVKSGGWYGEDNEDEDAEEDTYLNVKDNSPKGKVKEKILAIGKELNVLYTMIDNLQDNSNPAVKELQQKAAQIKANFGLFD